MQVNTELRIGGSRLQGPNGEPAGSLDRAVDRARQCRREEAYGSPCPRVCRLCGNCRGKAGNDVPR